MVVSPDLLTEKFKDIYDASPRFMTQAPGRVNLIGEHTDYNDGYVLPIAIDRTISIAFSPVESTDVQLYSLDFGTAERFDVENLEKREAGHWLNYPQGVAHVLRKHGHNLRGFIGVVGGDVPIGAGVSSSAAFDVAASLAFAVTSGLIVDRKRFALICQQVENEFVGVQCGIMDPYVSLNAEGHHGLFLDCRSIVHKQVLLHDDE